MKTIIWIASIIVFIVGVIFILNSGEDDNNDDSGSKDKTEQGGNGGGKPAMYTEVYILSSVAETHDVPADFRCKISGGRKKYYRSLNGGPEELRGGPNNKYLKSGDDIQSFTLRKYSGEGAAEKITATYYPY